MTVLIKSSGLRIKVSYLIAQLEISQLCCLKDFKDHKLFLSKSGLRLCVYIEYLDFKDQQLSFLLVQL